MTNLTHTPAPWGIEGNRDNDTQELRIVQASTGGEIAVIYPTLGHAKADIANARLIAAAPQLLAIVQAVAELRRKWRSQDEAETIDSIEYMDGLDALNVDPAIANAITA